jgi:hypothetical protein
MARDVPLTPLSEMVIDASGITDPAESMTVPLRVAESSWERAVKGKNKSMITDSQKTGLALLTELSGMGEFSRAG